MIIPLIKNFIGKFIKKNSSDKTIIVAKDKEHLKKIIKKEIRWYGNQCDLNHIDVSKIKNMNYIFYKSKFNGNISKWNVSNVEEMGHMFFDSKFNGDISNWNTSNVKTMNSMFSESKFNNDISTWDVSKVKYMIDMFYNSQFTKDLSTWLPYNLMSSMHMFAECKAPVPYWAIFEDNCKLKIAIENYLIKKELEKELGEHIKIEKRVKV